MKKFKLSLLLALLLISTSAFADYAPAFVQAALKKLYPTAQDVSWSRDGAYYVADFPADGFDTKVWFDTAGQWAMKQTNWETMDQVPPEVYNAFAASDYSDGIVQDVTWVQFPKWQPIVAVEVGKQNIQLKYQILFAPNGGILRVRNITYMYNVLGATTFL